jgi:hypothetical protein
VPVLRQGHRGERRVVSHGAPGPAETGVEHRRADGRLRPVPGDDAPRDRVHRAELDPVRLLRRQPTEQRPVHRQQGAQVRGDQHRVAASGQVLGPVQGEHRLAGAGRAADPRRAGPPPSDLLGLVGVQPGHPDLDRLPGRGLDQPGPQPLQVDQRRSGIGRCRDRGAGRRPSRAGTRRGGRRGHRRAAPVQDLDHPVDHRGLQPQATPHQVDVQVQLAGQHDPAERATGVSPAGQHEQRDHLGRRQPLGRQQLLDGVGLVEQLAHLVVGVGVTAPQPPALQPHLPPVLHVHHEDAAGSDQQHVDVGPPGAGPVPVGQHVPARVVHADQDADHAQLGPPAGRPVLLLAAQGVQHRGQLGDLPFHGVGLAAEQHRLPQGGVARLGVAPDAVHRPSFHARRGRRTRVDVSR